MHAYVWSYAHVFSAHRSQKRVSDTLELGLQVIVSRLMWMLGTQ